MEADVEVCLVREVKRMEKPKRQTKDPLRVQSGEWRKNIEKLVHP